MIGISYSQSNEFASIIIPTQFRQLETENIKLPMNHEVQTTLCMPIQRQNDNLTVA